MNSGPGRCPARRTPGAGAFAHHWRACRQSKQSLFNDGV